MKWTKEKPKFSGWYWNRSPHRLDSIDYFEVDKENVYLILPAEGGGNWTTNTNSHQYDWWEYSNEPLDKPEN